MDPSGCFAADTWNNNYYAATFHNTFLSRKAFLHGPAALPGNRSECVAAINITVPADGLYAPLVRFEASYRFSTMFRFAVRQQGQVVYESVYGGLHQAKVWPFRSCGSAEHDSPTVSCADCRYSWGTVESHVWQGQAERVPLVAGPAQLLLSVDRALTPTGGPTPSAERHIDVVVLHKNLSDVAWRLRTGCMMNNMPFDGLLTQQGDVFARVHAPPGACAMNLSLPFTIDHSSYWTHVRAGTQCSDLTHIFIGMHRNAPLTGGRCLHRKRVPGCTIPMVPMQLPPMAPMNPVEQIRALRGA